MSVKLLFLTPQLPYPPKSGGVIKSYHLLQHAAQHYELTLACLLKGDDDAVELQQHMPELKMLCSEKVDIPRTGLNFIRSVLHRMPLTIYRNRDRNFERHISRIIEQFDVVLVDHYVMFQYIPHHYRGRVVLHQHNAEYLIWQRMAEQVSGWIKRQIIAFEAKRIAQYEGDICAKADAVLAAPDDQQELAKLVHHTPIDFYLTYHLADESNLYKPKLDFELTEQQLLFVGTLSWQANWDGLLWFIEHSWPLIKAAKPETGFTIVGGYNDEQQQQIAELDPSIVLAGFVPDLEVCFTAHRVFIAPLTFGSGIKVKVVNSMYRGLPVVTTSIGAESLAVKHGEHLLIADDAAAFAQQVMLLFEDEALWQRLSDNSRQLCHQNYTWQRVYQYFDAAINDEQVRESVDG